MRRRGAEAKSVCCRLLPSLLSPPPPILRMMRVSLKPRVFIRRVDRIGRQVVENYIGSSIIADHHHEVYTVAQGKTQTVSKLR